ncbi:polyhydroxyalkanoate synthesis regulator [Paenibacillus sp.]|jgi:polyhydroxyalkanoate synthesis regulator phasin|uniref:phasin family protein n=1 Tax=Paenibacillus sp. TaxID=58172 RepID=UPI00281E04A3|nr:polyhydroxyalkanoate synthesis regulator [Paenibacillus sp.]MDR0267105.1 polyhydroxyalkanoate synthesis regulator [Paenibacillus sp.]
MGDLLKKAISLGWGLTIASKEKIEKTVEDLVKRGELAPSESKDLIDRLVERGEEEKSQFKIFLQEQIQRVLTELHVPSENVIASLEQRIVALEERIAELEGTGKEASPETDTQ